MALSRLLIVWTFLLLLMSIPALSDVDTLIPCSGSEECIDVGSDAYCNAATETCFQPEEEVQPAVTENQFLDLESNVDSLERQLQSLREASVSRGTVNALQASIATMQSQLNSINTAIQQLQGDAVGRQDLQQRLTPIATGLAGLQEDLNATQGEVSLLEKGLQREKLFTTLFSVIFFLLLASAISLAVYYYLTRGGAKRVVNKEVQEYITQHIQEGKKFPFIKESLLKAGWSGEDIMLAYKETLRRNYRNYLKQKSSGAAGAAESSEAGKTGAFAAFTAMDKSKIILISLFALLLILAVLFLLQGATGKAFWQFGGVADYEESVPRSTELQCFPPKLLAADGKSCCFDYNANKVCDTEEGFSPESLEAFAGEEAGQIIVEP